MSTPITMPRLSDSMEEGTVIEWLQSSGENVQAGDPIAFIETDKATAEIEAPVNGTLGVVVQVGESAKVGATLAYVGTPAELAEIALSQGETAGPPTDSKPEQARAHNSQRKSDQGSSLDADISGAPPRIRATPIARRMARESGIELDAVGAGSGPRGRIHKVDIERALIARSALDAPARAVVTESDPESRGDLVPRKRIEDLVARRMTQAKQDIPHYYLNTSVDCYRATRLRTKLTAKGVVRITLTDLIIQSCSRALRSVPLVNASWEQDGIRFHHDVNIGLAVALDDGGLVVPVIPTADRLTLAEIAQQRTNLIQRARDRSLGLDDLTGGTFTVSNLGMYGIDEFHAIINPPESAILAVGSVTERLVVHDGESAIRPVATLSLSADHRVYSGSTAATFLGAVRSCLEDPLRMLAGLTTGGS